MKKHGSRQKKGPVRLQLRYADGKVVFDDRIDHLSVEEKHIIDLSIHFFNDPAPCFIHRGAVLSRVFGELEAACGKDWIEINRLEEGIQKHLSMYEAREIRILLEE